jgi:predicted ATPase
VVTPRRIILSGCSGGGKSTLLAELARRGHAAVEEPGRRVVKAEVARGGDALPWVNAQRFMDLALDMAIADHAAAGPGITVFDRSVIDTAAAMIRHGHRLSDARAALAVCRYDPVVFLTPPWPAIFEVDAERKHSLDQAIAEYDALLMAFPANGYQVRVIPRLSVVARADWIGRELSRGRSGP